MYNKIIHGGIYMAIKNQVKALLATKGITMTQLVEMLNATYQKEDTLANLSKKLNKDTLKYREAEEIANVLDCDLQFVPRTAKQED